jgi:hypothetical protein
MAFFTQNKFNYTTGVPDGNDVYPSVSSTWGDDGAGVLGNGTIAFPTAAGGAGQVLTDVGGTGVLTFADAPSTSPSGSDTQVQYNNGGSFGGMAALTYNDSTGKIIANANASAGGDFEVLAETTGTALFVDVGSQAVTIGDGSTPTGVLTVKDNGSTLPSVLDVLADDQNVDILRLQNNTFSTNMDDGLKIKVTNTGIATIRHNSNAILDISTSGQLSLFNTIEIQDQVNSVKFVDNGSVKTAVVDIIADDATVDLLRLSNANFNADVTKGHRIKIINGGQIQFFANNVEYNEIDTSGNQLFLGGSGVTFQTDVNSVFNANSTAAIDFTVKSSAGSSLFVDGSGGKVTVNASASATGDFEVLAETTGTALFVDVSEKKFAIGTGAATNPLTVVSDANGVPILANAKGTSTTSLFLAADYLHTTTANMADNFGTGFRFQIEDVAGVVNDIASVYARRDGADNEGKLELLAGTDGAEVGLTLNSDLVIDIAQNFSQITAITDSGAVNSFERTTTDTSLIRPTFRMLSETSGNMADGFGTGMFFVIKDNTVTEVISAIYATRDGADNLGKLSFRTGLDGDVENAVLDAAGTFTLEQGVVSLKETTTPTSVADYGRIYFKSDNKAYAQTGDGVEHEIAFV